MSLKKEIKKDIWDLINNSRKEKSDMFFIFYIIRFLLNNNSINMGKVIEVVDKLKKEYEKIITEASEEIIDGKILDTIKKSNKKCDNRLKPILLRFFNEDYS